jgi:outer membrane protein assembly factor BamB
VAATFALLIVAALAPAASGAPSSAWPTYGFDTLHTGFSPNETRPSLANVGSLDPMWRVDLGGRTITSPVVGTGIVVRGRARTMIYVGTERGDLFGISASRHVEWRRNLGSAETGCPSMPGGVFGVGGTPVLDQAASRLYVAVNDGASGHVFVYALNPATGKTIPGWPVPVSDDPLHDHVWGALTLFAGRLYVATAGMCDRAPYFGRVFAIDVASGGIGATWSVVHDGDEVKQGGGIWGYGGAAVDPATGDVFVATGNALPPEPQDQPYAESVVRLDGRRLSVIASDTPGNFWGPDLDFGATPLVFKVPHCPAQVVAMNKSGALFVYLRDSIETGPIQRIRMAANLKDQGLFIGMPAYSPATRLLYVANSGPDRDPFLHGLVALHENSECRLRPAWQRVQGPNGKTSVSTPTVAGGVVYYGDGLRGRVFAFDAATGRRLWNSEESLRGPVFAAPVVARGRLYVSAWKGASGGEVVAFGTGKG